MKCEIRWEHGSSNPQALKACEMLKQVRFGPLHTTQIIKDHLEWSAQDGKQSILFNWPDSNYDEAFLALFSISSYLQLHLDNQKLFIDGMELLCLLTSLWKKQAT
jgi:hypothetical protein